MIKIAYLHGLGANNLSPKNEWLKSFAEVFDPQINYHEEKIYQKLKSKIKNYKPEIIIGSSMGGFFAYKIARELNINAILFNPALHSRSFEPDMRGFEDEKFKPNISFVFGKNDEIINPEKTIEILESEGYDLENYKIYNHGHDTPLEVFKSEILPDLEINPIS
ncbi:hypothetical protein EG338_05590 [Kaistella haifensis]|nr:hypothetical protein EG338_05590 [Kaistella haifensis]MCB4234378.1 hypothetical protein [Kaistella anthropi]